MKPKISFQNPPPNPLNERRGVLFNHLISKQNYVIGTEFATLIFGKVDLIICPRRPVLKRQDWARFVLTPKLPEPFWPITFLFWRNIVSEQQRLNNVHSNNHSNQKGLYCKVVHHTCFCFNSR